MTPRPKASQPIPPHAKKVFSGVLFDVYQWEQEQFDGSYQTFEKLKRADTVSIIPILPDGRVLIVDDEQPGRDAVVTFPGGRVEPEEDPVQTAKRELFEETGYVAKELQLWRAYHPVSKVDWVLYHFIARGCEKVGEQQLDPGERIATRTVTLDELIDISDDPRFQGKDLRLDFTKARLNAESRAELEKEFFGQ
ncbi:MAG TPA: NUDIX hydrolase [Candidatus Paceibacterota bacterium]|nr:NUDIX hydrolase [Candidatus Paceibacterota bacterium]